MLPDKNVQSYQHLPMKKHNNPATSKLAMCLDYELKAILMEDLKAFRQRNQFVNSNNQATVHQLSAA